MGSDYNEWSKMVGEIKKSYPLAQQYLEKVYVPFPFQSHF
jgi:hypothetical protein